MAVASSQIRVSEDVKERIENYGTAGDSYNDCLRNILDEIEGK